MKYFIEISYAGTKYHGWQIQKNAVSVQGVLNDSISLILGEKIETTGSGRTDTGVHAKCQAAHFSTGHSFDPVDLVYKLNSLLPGDIAVKQVRKVVDSAHARFDAISRSYIYVITQTKDPFLINRAYYLNRECNLELLNEAARLLKSYTDFESFSKVKTDVNNFLCNIMLAEWKQDGAQFVFHIKADRFLRGMVRAIVGTLIDLEKYDMDLETLKEIIESKDRKRAGRAVPAHGLYLSEVIYPENIYIS